MKRFLKIPLATLLRLVAVLAVGITLTIGWRPIIGPRSRPLRGSPLHKLSNAIGPENPACRTYRTVPNTPTIRPSANQSLWCGIRLPALRSVAYGFEMPRAVAISGTVIPASAG